MSPRDDGPPRLPEPASENRTRAKCTGTPLVYFEVALGPPGDKVIDAALEKIIEEAEKAGKGAAPGAR